jgi:hypothetical protein
MTAGSPIQPFVDALSADWVQALAHDEWFFADLIDNLTSRLSASEAFGSIDALVEVMVGQQDPSVSYYCGSLLINLVRCSNTTELPVGLRTSWEKVENQLSEYADILGQLRSWYRKP